MDQEFRTDFVTLYGFDFAAAALDLGVSIRSVIRWYEGYPNPLAKRLLRIMARGYLPETGIFAHWRIHQGRIYTPWGDFPASEVEYLMRYKWQARTLSARFRSLPDSYRELEERLNTILGESEEIKTIIRRMNGNA